VIDTAMLSTAVLSIGTAVGGFAGGRVSGRTSASQIATDTVDLLQAQIETLKDDKQNRDAELSELRTRVSTLESLVTQRAEVDLVHEEVRGARVVLDKIAIRVGA